MTRDEILQRTGWMGDMIMTFIEEEYPTLYSDMMLSEKMLPFVEKRKEEALTYMMDVEDKYLKQNPIPNTEDTLAVIQWRNQARDVAMEMTKEEVLFRKLIL